MGVRDQKERGTAPEGARAGRRDSWPPRGRPAAIEWVVLLPAVALGLVCAGHFQKPHSDFPAFWLGGEALLRGEFPTALLRPPAYSLLIVAVGRMLPEAFPWPEYPRPQAAAALINGLMLPVNALLVWLLARRVVGRGGAVWCAAAFAVLPAGLELAGHCLVEPMLLALMLGTVVCAERRPRIAWLLAALAAVTRYDAAGLFLGLLWVELQRGTRPGTALVRLGASATPMAAWLATTFSYWRVIGAGHYVTQIREGGAFLPAEFARTVQEAIFSTGAWATPLWLSGHAEAIRAAALAVFWLVAAIGLWRLFVAHRRTLAVMACAFGAYAAVHMVFPFQFVRFGYVVSPMAVVCAAGGAKQALEWAGRSRAIAVVAGTLAALVGAALLFAELERFLAGAGMQVGQMSGAAIFALTLTAAATFLGGAAAGFAAWRTRGWAVALPIFAWFAMYSARSAGALMGDGRQREDYVAALRWVAPFAAEKARVASSAPGMAALYAGFERHGCFVDVAALTADDSAGLRAECEEKGIGWLVWHEAELRESGQRYIAAARLRRFEGWPEAAAASGWRVVAEFAPRPRTWILAPGPAEAYAPAPANESMFADGDDGE